MWSIMFVGVIALIQSVHGGYEYPKPSIPFELPSQSVEDTADNIRKVNIIDTVTYSLPYGNYQYLQQQQNEESRHTVGVNDESVQQNFELSINKDQPLSISPQSNANIDTTASFDFKSKTASIHRGHLISQGAAIKESNSISEQPLLSANCPQLISNIQNKVPPLINLQNTEYFQNLQENSGVNLMDIENVVNILKENKNVLPLINLNNNHVSSINKNILSQSISIPDIDQQLNAHSSDVQHPQPSFPQNVNNKIETIESPIINLRESLPQVLNPQNGVQSSSIYGDLNFNAQVLNSQDNQIFLPNLNNEQIQLINIQSSQAAITRELNLQDNQPVFTKPVITKSISFHVPPPDIEETPVVPAVLPSKKIYKIIFIKAPATQDYQYNQQLQSALYNRLAPVEDKTIIYVLTKKPEVLPEQVALPQPTKVSEHEVLYVQYKGDQTITSEQELRNENISQLPLNSADASIQARYLDGH